MYGLDDLLATTDDSQAANLLARRQVYLHVVKQAAMPDVSKLPEQFLNYLKTTSPALQGLYGAGIGGGLGLASGVIRGKKRPLDSALTGAFAGGALGGGVGLFAQHAGDLIPHSGDPGPAYDMAKLRQGASNLVNPISRETSIVPGYPLGNAGLAATSHFGTKAIERVLDWEHRFANIREGLKQKPFYSDTQQMNDPKYAPLKDFFSDVGGGKVPYTDKNILQRLGQAAGNSLPSRMARGLVSNTKEMFSSPIHPAPPPPTPVAPPSAPASPPGAAAPIVPDLSGLPTENDPLHSMFGFHPTATPAKPAIANTKPNVTRPTNWLDAEKEPPTSDFYTHELSGGAGRLGAAVKSKSIPRQTLHYGGRYVLPGALLSLAPFWAAPSQVDAQSQAQAPALSHE